jgi:hypothetical protein
MKALSKKNVAIFRDIASCSQYVNRRFGVTYHLDLQSPKSSEQEINVQQVKIGMIFSSETLVHIRTIGLYIPGDGNVHTYFWENLK